MDSRPMARRGTVEAEQMRSQTVDIDGPVHFADFGGRGGTIVLVHGLGGSHVNWLGVGKLLTRHGRVVAPDLAGFGRTPLAGRSAALRANRRLLNRFVSEVADGPVLLVGNSMGGLISMLQAARNPESVRGLVLVGPAQPLPRGRRVDPKVALTFALSMVPPVAVLYMRWRLGRLGVEGLVRDMMRLVCAEPERLHPDLLDAQLRMARERTAMPWAYPAFLEASRSVAASILARRRFQEMIEKISAPSLLLHGTKDRLVPIAASRTTAKLRPDWEMVELDGIGHVPQMEDPELFVRTVTAWLEGSKPRDGTARRG